MSDSIIQIKNVNKWFGDFQVLKDINLEVEKNKKIVVCGPSGSGKSTLLNILSLIDKPSSGNIKIDGQSIDFNNHDLNDKIRASSIGIIYQNYNLLPDFTALENVSLAGLALNKNTKTSLNALAST